MTRERLAQKAKFLFVTTDQGATMVAHYRGFVVYSNASCALPELKRSLLDKLFLLISAQ